MEKVILMTFASMLIVGMVPMGAVAQDPTSLDADSFVCENSSTPSDGLGSLLESVITLAVSVGALIGVVGGTLFTVMSAVTVASEEGKEYTKFRNQAILYGLGSIIALYGLSALAGEINSDFAFGCLLP